MRWRFVDRMRDFEAWRRLQGLKCVSLEEYDLLAPLGQLGVFPRTLALECCVELARWLVARSSDFSYTGVTAEVERIAFANEVGMGDVLSLAVAADGAPEGRDLRVRCTAHCDGRPVFEGAVRMRLLPLGEAYDRDLVEGMWAELYGAA